MTTPRRFGFMRCLGAAALLATMLALSGCYVAPAPYGYYGGGYGGGYYRPAPYYAAPYRYRPYY